MTQPPHLIDALADLDEPTAPAYPLDQPAPLADLADVLLADEPPRRQPGQLVELFLADRDDVPTVRITNRERIAYEKTAARHREWPALDVGKHFAMTFMCYAAARRAGIVAGTFEQFCEALDDWEPVGDVAADPTR